MNDYDKEIVDDKLTQADLIKLMLHNAQHMATRDEVKADIQNLKVDLKEEIKKSEAFLEEKINKLDDRVDKLENKIDKLDNRIDKLDNRIDKLDNRIDKLDNRMDILDNRVDKLDKKFDRIQWLIISTIIAVLLKDQITGLFTAVVK